MKGLPRINLRTLWFEDIGFANQPTIDTPFGRMSVRQLAGLGFFALPAWIVFQALSFLGDVIVQIVPAGAVFLAGAVIFTWRVKTVPPERIILLALGLGKKGRRRPKKQKARAEAGKGAEKAPAAAPATGFKKAQATVGEPCKIVGILRDPRLGRPLPHRNFEVFADGVSLYKGSTDEQGGFEVVYIPQYPGVVRIEVRPDGIVGAGQGVEVTVKGAGVR